MTARPRPGTRRELPANLPFQSLGRLGTHCRRRCRAFAAPEHAPGRSDADALAAKIKEREARKKAEEEKKAAEAAKAERAAKYKARMAGEAAAEGADAEGADASATAASASSAAGGEKKKKKKKKAKKEIKLTAADMMLL